MTEPEAGAAGLALSAAMRAGVTVDEVHEIDELVELNRVIDTVWHREGEAVATDLLRALAHSGNCILAARSGTEMVGATVSFRGVHQGRPTLHSHITGIVPGSQLRGVGLALKLRQRAWALANAIESVTWTFDPLVSRNAHFNLTKLGAEADEYLVDFYGTLHDDANAGDATDRILAVWRLAGPRVARALSGRTPAPPVEFLLREGAPVVLDLGAGGEPVLAGLAAWAGTTAGRPDRALARIPDDILAVRSRDRRQSDAWRGALREVMTTLFAVGLRPVAAFAPGWYVFGPDGSDWPA
ncbi:MAG: GNAT family N-acetyltransferase [Candidatus Dormibacteria bacterium]|jgi:predicted GNAT superfamily acetyltransferase